MFTVGMVQENCFLFRRDGSDRALIVDPGDEAPRLLGAIDELGVTLDGILLTHTHFDHVGAVAPVAKATGAEVWVPELEKPVLADINAFVPWPDFGPFESWDAEHTVAGGEKLELAGLRHRRAVHARAQPRPRDLLDPRRAGACSPATCCSRARSAAPTCPAATGRRCWSRSARLVDTLPEETRGVPRATWA